MTPPLLNVVTDKAMADLFAVKVGSEVRWDAVNTVWRTYDGIAWRVDRRGHVRELAKNVVTDAAKAALDANDPELARKMLAWHRQQGLSAILELAKSVPGIPALPEDFDRDGWLLNTLTHTVDLRTGVPRPHNPADLLTKVCPAAYDPQAKCPRWLAFLDRIFASNTALIASVQRIVGYTLVGAVLEHAFIVFWGTGANGKTTLTHVLLRLAGDYGMAVRPEVFLDHDADPQGFALADLPGVRVIVGSEISPGRRKLNESLVKSMTGRDRIRASHKYGRPFEFEPVFKPILATNHKPVIEGQDHAIWRRLKLVPFTVTIPESEQDAGLPDKLVEELPGILNWALKGCHEWQHIGLAFPEEVTQATANYRAEQDILGDWIEARCVIQPDIADEIAGLYADYAGWCQDHSETPVKMKRFAGALDDKGFVSVKGAKGKRRRRGIAVASVSETGGASPEVAHPQSCLSESLAPTRVSDFLKSGPDAPPAPPAADPDQVMARVRAALDKEYGPDGAGDGGRSPAEFGRPKVVGWHCPRGGHQHAELWREGPGAPWHCRACRTEAVEGAL
jgi:putative DNA primase/helicase